MSDYKYDVFISYPHEEDHETWVHDIFLSNFGLYLTQELGRKPELFVDEKGIKPGQTWDLKLKEALAHSRLLVPIWSVNYFLSNWCRWECAVFLYREEKLGYRKSKSDGLIHPVQLYDGKRYPKVARTIQWFGCEDHNVFNESYKKTESYSRLKDAIKQWVPDVAQSIDAAPPWNQDWIAQSWVDEAIDKWDKHPDFQILKQPWSGPSMAGE
jgi:hypothetical protein